MRFDVLGPLQVTVGEEIVQPGAPQQQKLLAVLLSSPNHLVSSDRLIDEIWTDEAPPSARHLVQVYISRLRALLGSNENGPRIVREGSGYAIRVDPQEVDALQLAESADEARALLGDNPAAAEQMLLPLVELWRGKPFGDLSDESPALRSEAVRLEELYLSAVADRIDAGLKLGHHETVVVDLETLTRQHPYRERFWRQLMLALYRSGRQVEALRAAQVLRDSLAKDLGIEPSPEVLTLEEAILMQDPALLWQPPPPPNNLPAHLTSFIGRSEETAEIAKLLDTVRLVTLTGPGGIGKTRLATEVAERTLLRYPDGVWWLDLAPLTEPDMVVVGLARLLGVSTQPGTPLIDVVTRSLTRREALLVIDNCEHLSAATASVVDSVLRSVRQVRILSTSRTPLHVAGEALWVVPALAMPLSDELSPADLPISDAIRLFLERGALVEPSFTLTPDNADAIVEVCRRLDAMPLAIEMAAARVRALSPAQLAASLIDRFAVLKQPDHATVPRHETLAAAVDWSYTLLEPALQLAFDRLSVFPEAFGLEAAAAVALGDTDHHRALEVITGLVEASMVTTVSGGPSDIRYRMLETLREYGARSLQIRGESEEVRAMHADYFLGLAIQAGEFVGTPDFEPWLGRLKASYDDLQQALDWSLSHHPRASTLRVAPTMFHFWFRTGDAPEANRWGELMLLEADEAPAELRAAAHMSISFGATILGDPVGAHTHIDEAIRLLRESGDQPGLVMALFGKGQTALQVGDFEGVKECCREALAICDERQDRWGRAGLLSTLSFANLYGGGSLKEARTLAEEALVLHRELGDRASQVILNPLPVIALMQSDLAGAERFAVASVAAAAGSGWEATALVNLAEVLLAKGDLDRSGENLRRGLIRALDSGLENWFRIALRDLAQLAVRLGEFVEAALLIGASRRNMPEWGLAPDIYESVETACRSALGGDAFTHRSQEGYHMTHEQLLELALGRAPT